MVRKMSIRFVKREMTKSRINISAVLMVLILYILWMSTAAVYLQGDLVSGVYWQSAPPGSLFPFPYGPGVLQMLVLANPVDTFIYCAIFNSGFWIVVIILSALYIVSPFSVTMRAETGN
jgi:hypothetical protein